MEVEQTEATSLNSVIKDTLISIVTLQLAMVVAKHIQWGANMAGNLNGIASQIQREEPKVLYTAWPFHKSLPLRIWKKSLPI